MSFLGWLTFSGALLMLMALSSAYVQRLPVSTSTIYLAVGVAISPLGFDLASLDARDANWLERLAEIAVIISLFIGGLRLRLPLRNPAWRAAVRMAGPVMLVSILGLAALLHVALGLDLGTSLLVGAIVAPTDPVLARAVAVNDAGDHDRMRYGISGEAGLNDGMAFPFVVLGMLWIQHDGVGDWLGPWALHRLVWAVPAGLAIGYLLGSSIGRLAIKLRTHFRDTDAPSDFLALAVILISYVAAETAYAWGFLAVFAAGVGVRHAEMIVVTRSPHPEIEPAQTADATVPHPPAEELAPRVSSSGELEQPAVAAGVLVAETLSFGDTVERMLEVVLVLLVGVGLASHWDVRAIPIGLALFLVIRPLTTQLLLVGTPTTTVQRWAMGWFGIRGIGSIYYLGYAISHDVPTTTATVAAGLVFPIIALSIVLHGISATPLLARYEQALARRTRARAPS